MSDVRENEIPIVYEDDQLIAVNKPSGLFVHRSAADRSATSFLLQMVRDQIDVFLYPVHRLDRATSGIVLFAKSSAVAASLSQLFADRLVTKTYQALVRGHCDKAGQISIPLISARGREKPPGHPFREPKQAETEFRSLKRFEIPLKSDRYPTTRCAFVEVRPLTGRYHQIRRHLNYVSHPVIGDSSHGDTRQNRFFAKHFQCERLMLAAVEISLPHPVSHERIAISCPADPSFTDVLQKLEHRRVD